MTNHPAKPVSLRSRAGLNAANFFLAELTGVVMPFLAKFLAECGWKDGTVGVTVATAGLGVCLMQAPAGYIVDRVRRRRMLLAGSSLVVGIAYGLLPLLPADWRIVDPLVFVAGTANSFFGPLLGALALGLVGHAALTRTLGVNQGWNHAGNIAAAATAMLLAAWLGLPSIFYAVAVVSILAAASVLLIRDGEIDEARVCGKESGGTDCIETKSLFRDRRILVLLAATALFHMANAPAMPLVGLYIARLGGTDTQVAAVVLVAQLVMIPVALAAGWFSDRWGRKPVFAIGFVVLPLRIFLYSLTTNPQTLIALQTLDGIGAGIYGVVIVAMCADLTRGRGGFNALQGLIATALSIGGVIGPLVAGFVVQYLGFAAAFELFAGVAATGAVLFLTMMPETRPSSLTADSAREEPYARPSSLNNHRPPADLEHIHDVRVVRAP